jgi:hypothetical protein
MSSGTRPGGRRPSQNTGNTALAYLQSRRTPPTVALLLTLLVAACLPRFRQPDIRLETVRLGSLDLGGGTLIAGLVVNNPNTYEMRSSALHVVRPR